MDYLDEFLQSSKLRLQAILGQLNWTENQTCDKTMNIGKDSQIPLGTNEEPPLPPSCVVSNSVKLKVEDLQQLLGDPLMQAPEKFSDLQINFNREQKLALYDYTVKRKKDAPPLALAENDLVSLADIVEMKKREKTKRRKYRISKPTQTEEVRSLVELQMQALRQFFEDKQKIETKKLSSNRFRSESEEYEHKRKYEKEIKRRKDHGIHGKSSRNEQYTNRSRKVENMEAKNRTTSESRSRRPNNIYRHRSRSRSPSRHHRREKSRSPSRHKKKDRSRNRDKKKHKKSHKHRHKSR